MSDKFMDTQPGGESTQYESIKTVTEPSDKQQGQLGGDSSATQSEPKVSAERGEQTAENVRYGQAISESGFGGKTTTSEGLANQGGYGRVDAQDEPTKSTRREQGYGGGNDVGA